jgi:hypothetical protein
MHSRKFESKAALVAYAEHNGLTCLMEFSPNGADGLENSFGGIEKIANKKTKIAMLCESSLEDAVERAMRGVQEFGGG